jgi:hypothetical protein
MGSKSYLCVIVVSSQQLFELLRLRHSPGERQCDTNNLQFRLDALKIGAQPNHQASKLTESAPLPVESFWTSYNRRGTGMILSTEFMEPDTRSDRDTRITLVGVKALMRK